MAQKSSSNFQIILTGLFIIFAVVAVLIFSGIIKIGSSGTNSAATGNVVLWGTLPNASMGKLLREYLQAKESTFSITYVQKNPLTIDNDLVEAIASGTGPDLVFVSNDKILKYRNKIMPIPYTSLSQATFQSTLIQEGDLYLAPQGILGIPIMVDPLVMYYNLDMLQSAGIALPPATWNDLVALVPKLTIPDVAVNSIKKSTVALGTYSNITHAKDVLSLFFLQAGNPIVMRKDTELNSVLAGSTNSTLSDGSKKALQFYMSFADPAQAAYSWNRSRPDSRTSFIQGDLAFYFGYASELFSIQTQNPNLNFNVALMPQPKDAQAKVTFGRITGISVLKSSKNIPGAFAAASLMATADFESQLVALPDISLPPVRRDLLSARPTGTTQQYVSTFYNSALIARAWLDPDITATDKLFSDIINNSYSGLLTYDSALNQASNTLDLILRALPPVTPSR